jgi:hypothetical protein
MDVSSNSIGRLPSHAILRFAELFLGIIAACVPCLKSLSERVLRRVGFDVSSKSKGSDAGYELPRPKNDGFHTLEGSLTTDDDEPRLARGQQVELLESGIQPNTVKRPMSNEPRSWYSP